MPVYGPNLDIASNGSGSFPLIAQLVDLRKKEGQYTSKSDASLHINNFPHLILEVLLTTLNRIGFYAWAGRLSC